MTELQKSRKHLAEALIALDPSKEPLLVDQILALLRAIDARLQVAA